MAKIDIISGFLGAGKTTLIKKLLGEALKGQQVVLIENEFGEIGIDGGFLKDAGVNITEMNSGCICCSLVGDFGTALKDVITKFNPDRIIIEPSGVGKLSDVIKAVQGVAEDAPIELNSLVTVADANKCKMYMKNFGEFYNNQVESAHTIVLSRTQNMKQDKLEACVAMIREHNKEAAVITTPWDELTGEQLLAAMEKPVSLADMVMAEEEICPVCGGHHDHDDHEHEHHHDHDHDDHCGCDHDHDHEHEHHHDHDHDDHCGCDHDHNHEHEHHHDHDHDDHCGCGHDHDHHHHHADEVFTSWGKETPRKYTKEEVETILKALAAENNEYGIILRAKGMLPSPDGTWIYFDMVPEEYEIREGQPEYTGRLCVIGSKIDEAKLEKLFML
ncbi:CobW family GTP-binding protein [Coprococcus catus]|uniref:CobW family GTP-binding protein n=1 Tax=Coprococcus catus TaxID=116085 RepID=UPI001C8C0BBF|nr:CobW family GTP-binding protein [Coprococcus catus]MBX9231895.1 GTP-binding protein [Coprococcus catus]MCT6800347.1 GTP-binding protein [Coprococcus catus]